MNAHDGSRSARERAFNFGGSRLNVSGFNIHDTGVAPTRGIELAVPTKVKGVVMTSAPGANVESHASDNHRMHRHKQWQCDWTSRRLSHSSRLQPPDPK